MQGPGNSTVCYVQPEDSKKLTSLMIISINILVPPILGQQYHHESEARYPTTTS